MTWNEYGVLAPVSVTGESSLTAAFLYGNCWANSCSTSPLAAPVTDPLIWAWERLPPRKTTNTSPVTGFSLTWR